MMTFKEIDARINHYQEELEWSVMILKNTIKDEEYDTKLDVIAILGYEKARVEFFSFVTATYIDLLCTYRNPANWTRNTADGQTPLFLRKWTSPLNS